ncbi:MAG: polyribonucleotide nucleotidyltransferase [Oscillospiraceae bacterium]|nr:polyribonucleotide nucleotidyltransferase [Oscillospiraceae bacterium]
MADNYKVFKTTLAGKEFTVETGKSSELTNGSCWVRCGDTVVMANVTMSDKPREGVDYFPLSVDYEEKLYAAGKIPGSFMKREGRPSENAILTSRLVDRPMRPLFPDEMRNDVSLTMTVLSTDVDNSPEALAMVAGSIAVAISDIPWNGPIAGVNAGLVDGEIILNPNTEQRAKSDLDLTVAGTKDKVVMIEAGANEVSEDVMLRAIVTAHDEIKNIVEFIEKIVAEAGKTKIEFTPVTVPEDMYGRVKEMALDKVKFALDTDDKNIREERLSPIYEEVKTALAEDYPDQDSLIDECMYKLQKYIVRRWLLDEQKRVDGRGMDEIRPLRSEVGLLPRTHGSGMFTRGQTQVLSIATLGPISDAQMLDGIDEHDEKRYMHNYNFPSYSVGETRPNRGPGRREIGHGALAERAIVPVLPSQEDFPYAIRVVSEILSSNGSTSQGAICGSALALMDAGVPLKSPVAGISCGLITEGDRFMTMVDIQGLEDFFGDMDFKVGGTRNGITAIQVDIKIDGLTTEIIAEAFEKTRKARLLILDGCMLKAIPEPRSEVSKYAPKMLRMKIDVDKIREVIGSGGKVIQKICAECDVKIDINDDGNVFISGIDIENVKRAYAIVETIAKNPEIGAIYKGRVTRLMTFGAFVEIAPGKEGLVHVSKLDLTRVEKVEDIVKVDDEIVVKVVEIDDQGRINLSRKDAILELQAKQKNA